MTVAPRSAIRSVFLWQSAMKLLLLLSTCASCAIATWTLSGYACNQQQLYSQCQCPSFCGGYSSSSYYPQYSSQYSPYQDDQMDRYRAFVKKHRPHKKRPSHTHTHKKKKFKFSEEEEEEPKLELEEFDSKEFTTSSPVRSTTNSWDNEEAWERKFVKAKTHTSEELPEINSAEIEAARTRPSPATSNYRPQSSGGSGLGGIGIGGGVGVGGIGVNTGLGISAPGIGGGGGGLGGLGGGGGGLVGVSSGLGIGIPGVGPIGISSGLGIGK